MGLSTLTDMPSAIVAGDTILLSWRQSAYPAGAGWTVNFSFRALDGSAVDFSSTQDGATDNHLFNVPAGTTAEWKPGLYNGTAKAVNTDGTALTFWRGSLNIQPDLSAEDAGFDGRSWARRCLDAIQAVLEGRASKSTLNTSIAGQTLGHMTPEQLWAMRDRFMIEVQQELSAEATKQGKHSRNTIAVTFTRP